MPELRIEIVKRADGGSVLRCTRADRTVTWQSLTGPQAAFFPLHDLTHYAVETVLGVSDGFFGLVARGWEIEDTTGKGARGALPPDALVVERIVGFFDIERATGHRWTAAEFVEQLELAGAVLSPFLREALTDDALMRIRALRSDLFARWASAPAGATMELVFDETGS